MKCTKQTMRKPEEKWTWRDEYEPSGYNMWTYKIIDPSGKTRFSVDSEELAIRIVHCLEACKNLTNEVLEENVYFPM